MARARATCLLLETSQSGWLQNVLMGAKTYPCDDERVDYTVTRNRLRLLLGETPVFLSAVPRLHVIISNSSQSVAMVTTFTTTHEEESILQFVT